MIFYKEVLLIYQPREDGVKAIKLWTLFSQGAHTSLCVYNKDKVALKCTNTAAWQLFYSNTPCPRF